MWGHFCPLWVPIWRRSSPKYGYFWGQNPASMAGWFQGEDPTWKWFYVPYHTPMHGTTLFRAIFALSRHPSRVPGVQKWLFLRSESGHYGRLSRGHIVPPGKCLVRHITPQCREQHYLGSLLPSPGTYPGLQGSKNGYFWGQNQATMAGCLQVIPSHLESVKCAISHPNT